jgi:hypothetical protein
MRIRTGSEIAEDALAWQQAMNAVRTNGGTFEGWHGHGSWEGVGHDPENGGYLDAPNRWQARKRAARLRAAS